MSMTRKDFEILAEGQRTIKPNRRDYSIVGEYDCALMQWKMGVANIMTSCTRINDRFNDETFKKTSGWYD